MTNECKLQAVGNKLVVKRDSETETTAGGLYLSDDAKEKPIIGTVLAVGPGLYTTTSPIERIPLDIKVGAKVVFQKYGGTEFEHNDEEYLLLTETDVLCVINPTSCQCN